ncbi:MAG: hypothetical protein EBU88_10490 [Acidobacteria bacterium]|nr:hypothetical protein [Acidobacteriota bacterium]
MNGEPINQAQQSIEAGLGTLSPQDQFGLVACDSSIEIMTEKLHEASLRNREVVRSFLDMV